MIRRMLQWIVCACGLLVAACGGADSFVVDGQIATVTFPLKSALQRQANANDGKNSTVNDGEGINESKSEGKKILPRQQKILELFKSNPTISIVEMASELNVSISTIEREIPKMTALIKHMGPKKGGHWEIKKD